MLPSLPGEARLNRCLPPVTARPCTWLIARRAARAQSRFISRRFRAAAVTLWKLVRLWVRAGS
jgi:hypothetical protein